MATVRQYAYIIKGNHIALVEKATNFDNDVSSKDYGPGSDRIQWKSPLADSTDGMAIVYAYTPKYRYNDESATKIGTKILENDDGLLTLYSASHGLSAGAWIVVKDSERANGLHQIKSVDTHEITTYSKYSGVNYTTDISFKIFFDIDVLNDEDDVIDVSSYLSKALVWYVKARFLEDAGDIEKHEYYMRKFKKMLEKHENSRVAGPRVIVPNSHFST